MGGKTLKVLDFDLARWVPHGDDENSAFLMTKKMGSPRWMAPEVAMGKSYNLTADVYSFSLLCHELLSLEQRSW